MTALLSQCRPLDGAALALEGLPHAQAFTYAPKQVQSSKLAWVHLCDQLFSVLLLFEPRPP